MLVFFLCATFTFTVSTTKLDGKVLSLNDKPIPPQLSSTLIVYVYENDLVDGRPTPLSFKNIFETKKPKAITHGCNATGSFVISSSELHEKKWYSVFGFQDTNGNHKYDVGDFEASGWFTAGKSNWLFPFRIKDTPTVTFRLNAIKPFPSKPLNSSHGQLLVKKGYHVLQLRGNHSTRGYAQGALIAPYIKQFFRFFILQETTPSVSVYENEVLPFVKKYYSFPTAMTAAATQLIQGMRDTDPDSLFIPELSRELTPIDILYENLYGSYELNVTSGSVGYRRGCSQFAFWGNATKHTAANGGTIVGRNMDGENDIRKVTVANLLIFGITPETSIRYVHVFWPGMISSASGFNQHGIHVMENDGSSEPGKSWKGGYTPDQWVQKEVLEKAKDLTDAKAIIKTYEDKSGGVCSVGCALMLAQPVRSGASASPPAMVYEGDRKGGYFRQPGEVQPLYNNTIMVTNHFLKYGWTPAQPLDNFDQQVYFSSLWRYAAGSAHVSADEDNNKEMDTTELIGLLQTVNHASTEHSVITYPNQMKIAISNSDMKSHGWYSPYDTYTEFSFEELFMP